MWYNRDDAAVSRRPSPKGGTAMARHWKQLGAALLAFALLLSLSVSQTGASASGSYCFTALNEKLQPLSGNTMPVLVKTSRSSTLYIPLSLFDSRTTGVDLGVYCGGDGKPTATLYSRSQSLTFNLDDGTTFSGDGDQKLCMALWRNGRVYVPANWVCNYFGLTLSMLTTDYGDLVRITNGNEALNNEQFIDAAPNHLQYYLNLYNQALASDAPATASPSSTVAPATPSPSADPQEPGSLQVALAFRCAGGDVSALLDALDSRKLKALLLFDPTRLPEQADLVRRAAASGHTIGLTVEAGTAEDALSALAEGDRLLRSICYTRSRVAELPGASDGLTAGVEEAGWRIWQSGVDAAGEENPSTSRLYRAILREESPVRVTLSPSAAPLLGQLQLRLSSGGHTLYTPTESGL